MAEQLWCPSARRLIMPGLNGCGPMLGGPPRATHHTTEGSTIDGAVATYQKTHDYPTFTIDYARDDVAQHIPADQGATALKHTSDPQTNRIGTFNIQIEWVGQAAHPEWSRKPAGPKVRAFFDWLRSLGIPDVWPNGSPLPYPQSYGANGQRSATVWATKAGHYGHSQVPENEHGDPGAISPAFVKQTAKPKAAPKPAPKATPRPAPSKEPAKPAPKPAPAKAPAKPATAKPTPAKATAPKPAAAKPTPSPKPTPYRYRRTLKLGSVGGDVCHLQRALHLQPTGFYGLRTRDRVKTMQRQARLLPDGIYGPLSQQHFGQ